jgi:hypothetical protein
MCPDKISKRRNRKMLPKKQDNFSIPQNVLWVVIPEGAGARVTWSGRTCSPGCETPPASAAKSEQTHRWIKRMRQKQFNSDL